jgi:hypothetical protein
MGATIYFESTSELATLTNTFKVNNVATDPTTVTLRVTTPSQTTATYTYALGQITKTSTGVYTKDIACSEAGTWSYEWVGTGAASDAIDGTWDVLPTALGKLYATVDVLKSRLGIPSTDTVDEFELHTACFSASREIEQYCERVFYRTQEEIRTFEPFGMYGLRLPEFNDLVSITTLKTDASGAGAYETTWASTDYQLLPLNPTAAPEQKPYTRIKALNRAFPITYTQSARCDTVQITGVFGWPQVPLAIKQATLVIAAETFKLKDAPFGVAAFGEYGPMRVRDNPKVAKMAGPYRRNAVLVA